MSPLSNPPTATANPDSKLKRSLGLWQLTLLGVSTQIGSGWLFAVLSSAAIAGPAAILSWVIGAVLIAIVSLTWIELGTLFPRSGGIVRTRPCPTGLSPGGSPAGATGSARCVCRPSRRKRC